MQHDEIVLVPVEVPLPFRVIPDPALVELSPEQRNCKICRSSHVEEIELLCLNSFSFAHNAAQVKRVFGISVRANTLKQHLLEHTAFARSLAVASQVKAAQEFYGKEELDKDPPLAKSIIEFLMADIFNRLSLGEFSAHSMNDVMKVMSLADAMRGTDHKVSVDNRRLEAETGGTSYSAEDLFRQLGYIMDALRATVPREYLSPAIRAAWERGLGMDLVDLSGVPIYQHGNYEMVDLSQVVRDVKKFGRPRTQLELMAASEEDEEEVIDDDVPPE